MVKCSGDVTRLQALVDKKRIVISEEVVREILQLNDAEGVICLPNKEIFAGLTRIGYEKPSTKLTFYKAFSQLNGSQRFNFSKYIFKSLVRNVDSSSKFYIVGKGFSGVETPLFESMLAVRDVAAEAEAQVPAQGLENDKAGQQLEIVKLKARVKKLEKIHKVKSSKLRRLKKVRTSQRVKSSDDVENVFNQGRMIVDMDQDKGIELVTIQEKDEIEGRHADKQAKIYNIDLDHSSKVLSMQEDDTKVQEAVEIVTTAKLMTEVVTAAATQVVAASTPIPVAKPKTLTITAAPAVSTRRRKGVVIRDPKEELSFDTQAETPKVKDKGKGILIEAPKPIKKKDQIEMDAETPKSKEEMEKEDEEIIKSINEPPAQKASKRRKLSKEAQEADDLRKRLEIVQDEDDDD
nr:hypothetical protein [Tanacetum cinerariifolium]